MAVTTKTTKKASVSRLFWEQVALNFIVVAILIACGALLTFEVMGEEYSEWTIVGFFATVFFAFIVFLPVGTLFAARAEFAKGRVQVQDDEKTGATAPIANPLLKTAPLGVVFAAIGTAIVYLLVYRGGWMPSPQVTTLASLLFVVPYAVIVRLNIFRDIEGLAAQGAFRAKPVSSKTQHIWMTYGRKPAPPNWMSGRRLFGERSASGRSPACSSTFAGFRNLMGAHQR